MRSVSWLLAEPCLCITDLLPCLFSLLSSSLPQTALTPLSLSSLLLSPEETYSCEVRIIPVDFSDGQEIYPHIAEELQDLDIGVLGKVPSFSNSQPLALLCGWTNFVHVCVTLVNNVGYGADPDYFAETPEDVSCEKQRFCCFLTCASSCFHSNTTRLFRSTVIL